MSSVNRLIEIYQGTPRSIKEEGRCWYPSARSFFSSLARKRGLAESTVLGCVAALSPFVSWKTQLERTDDFLVTRRFPGFGSNVRSAIRILSGANPDSVLKGPKVRQFYLNLLGDTNGVTLDRHAISACGYHGTGAHSRRTLDRLREAYRIAARACKETPRDFQAIVWSQWKRMKDEKRK